jgi:flagellar biogenesis protein FliO
VERVNFRRVVERERDMFMRTQLKATLISMGIGIAIFGLLAYSLMLFSVTQSIASKENTDVTATR